MAYSTLKTPKLGHFSRNLHEICTHIHLTCFFHTYSFFESSRNFPIFFVKIFFCWLFFIFFKIFEISKIRYRSLIETFILNLLLKSSCFYLLNCMRYNVSRKPLSRKPLFLPKNRKTWRHFDLIYGRRIKHSKFSFCKDVSN